MGAGVQVRLRGSYFSRHVASFLGRGPSIKGGLCETSERRILLFVIFSLGGAVPLALRGLICVVGTSAIGSSVLTGLTPGVVRSELDRCFG